MTESNEQVEQVEQTGESAEQGSGRGRRKTRTGVVVSDKMDKTVVVQIERLVKHAVYGRYIRRRKKYKVHDEQNECRVGDVVNFTETRPMSKDKCWRFVNFVRRAE
jgi:small subunit ribosomal protein S17